MFSNGKSVRGRKGPITGGWGVGAGICLVCVQLSHVCLEQRERHITDTVNVQTPSATSFPPRRMSTGL